MSTIGAGAAIALVGLGVFLARLKLAVVFLGATTLFGVPLTNADSGKIFVVGLLGFSAMAIGGLGILVGAAIALIAYANRSLSSR